MKKTIVAALLATSMGSATAADLPSRKAAVYVPPPPVFTWTGFYVGLNAGATFSNNNSGQTVGVPVSGDPFLNLNILGLIVGAATTPGLTSAVSSSTTSRANFGSRTSALLGAQAGYNYQFGPSFVAGFEADIQGVLGAGQRARFANANTIGAANINVNVLGVPAVNAGDPFATSASGILSKRLDYLGTARARFGYLVTPTLLAYATGGLAYGGVKSSTAFTTSVQATGPVGASFGAVNVLGGQGGYSTTRVGYTVGGGLEWMFMPTWSLKAEYLYYDLGSASYSGGAGLGNVTGFNAAALGGFATGTSAFTNIVRTRVRYDGNVARVGVNYHFWGPPADAVVARY